MPKTTLHINSGICKCGCSWKDHHLGMIVNWNTVVAVKLYYEKNFSDRTFEGVNGYPLYVPQECEKYGCNEDGGMRYNKETQEMEDHCHGYEDKDGPLGEVEY